MHQRPAPAALSSAHRLFPPGIGVLALSACIWVTPGLVAAQTPGPPASAASATKTEAAAAMERAQRMAANPLRIILEAGKLKRGPVAAEGVPAVAAPVARPAPATAVAGNSVLAKSAPAAAAAAPAVTAAVAPPVAVPVTASPPPVAPTTAMPAAPTPAAAVPDVVLPQPDTPPLPVPTPAEPAALRIEQPRLLVMVEPQLPRSVADGMSGSTEVAIDLTIRADGSVALVTLLPPVPRALQRYIVAALENWRFAPLPAQRVHRVNLVINGVP